MNPVQHCHMIGDRDPASVCLSSNPASDHLNQAYSWQTVALGETKEDSGQTGGQANVKFERAGESASRSREFTKIWTCLRFGQKVLP